jgi:hypothetical protein
MTEEQQARFRNKRQLVALFRAQVELLRGADPHGIGRVLDTVPFKRYDDLLALGPTGRWPSGMLAGLKQGIRDAQASGMRPWRRCARSLPGYMMRR